MNQGFFLAKGQHVTESVSLLLFGSEQTTGALCGFMKKIKKEFLVCSINIALLLILGTFHFFKFLAFVSGFC